MQLNQVALSQVKGIGKAKEEKLKVLGIGHVDALLAYYPRDYIDRTKMKAIETMYPGEDVLFKGLVTKPIREIVAKGGMKICETFVTDGQKELKLRWFNQNYVKFKIRKGQQYLFFGKIYDEKKHLTVINPAFEDFDSEHGNFVGIIPVYGLMAGIGQSTLRQSIKQAFDQFGQHLHSALPLEIRKRYQLLAFEEAIGTLHFPEDFTKLEVARRTLIFEELFWLQLRLLSIKAKLHTLPKKRHYSAKAQELDAFMASLPFQLTCAQQKVLKEIMADMDSGKILNRLVQGDVGSGKTVVAAAAILKAVKSGFQSAMMAPTEVLAKQHYEELTRWFTPFGIRVALLTGSMSKKEKNYCKSLLTDGRVDVLVGTHALIQEDVIFQDLALVVTDEQHRFGVRQRMKISNKGQETDVLVMSATPIPRTLALILYGDLDVSIIDEMPKGRIPVETHIIKEDRREGLQQFIKENIAQGGQAFIVCPLIEESEKLESLKSAASLWEDYAKGAFADYTVGLLHGKMSEEEKDAVIQAFAKGELQLLVSTTVIEVGVNIPNANMMVIENAERFGLPQIHQLRGRVGRGTRKSYCFLFNQSDSVYSKNRLSILKASNDGFKISEKDLALRGPGDFFGFRQHGLPSLKLANLCNDLAVLKEVQEVVASIPQAQMEVLLKDVSPEWVPL